MCDFMCGLNEGGGHVTDEWEEGKLGGHRSPTQASSLLLFLLVKVEPKGRRERRSPLHSQYLLIKKPIQYNQAN